MRVSVMVRVRVREMARGSAYVARQARHVSPQRREAKFERHFLAGRVNLDGRQGSQGLDGSRHRLLAGWLQRL